VEKCVKLTHRHDIVSKGVPIPRSVVDLVIVLMRFIDENHQRNGEATHEIQRYEPSPLLSATGSARHSQLHEKITTIFLIEY